MLKNFGTEEKLMIESNIFSPVQHRYSLAINEIIDNAPNILDVGGYISRKEVISNLCDSFLYTSLNVGSAWYKDAIADYLYDGLHIPFNDNEYDFVISVDILEHVPAENREQLIKEIIRVTTKRAIIVTPFRIQGADTDEKYILDICNRYNILPPPSLVEHELYGLPFKEDIEYYTKKMNGTFKYATFKKDYWYLQTAMLWNTIALNGKSEILNRDIQKFQEQHLSEQAYPKDAKDAYRCVMIFDK